jgi:hypothetical protein
MELLFPDLSICGLYIQTICVYPNRIVELATHCTRLDLWAILHSRLWHIHCDQLKLEDGCNDVGFPQMNTTY